MSVTSTTVTTVKLNQLLLAPQWNRETLGGINDLVASIKEVGQLQPIIVREAGNEKGTRYYIIDGRRRYAALQQLQQDPLVLILDVKDAAQAFLKSMVANLARDDNSAYDIARSFEILVGEGGYTHEKIAKACGKTAGYVSQHVTAIRIANAHKPLLAAFRRNEIPLSFFRYAARLDVEEDAKMLEKITTAALKGVAAQDIGERISVYLEKKSRKEKESAKGAAAHQKKKAGPRFRLTDYSDPTVRKLMKKVNLSNTIDRAQYHQNKLQQSSSKQKQYYHQGWIDALEYSMGLVEED